MNILIQDLYEFVNSYAVPGSIVEHFILKTAEEAFTSGIIRRAALLGHRPYESRVLHALNPSWPAVVAASVAVHYGMLSIRQC